MNRLAAFLIALALFPAAAADPPGRVGRLAWIEGEALTFTDAETGWEGARINSHLTSVAYPILEEAGELRPSRLATA